MNGKQLKKILEENNWVLDRIAGSHHIMIKPGSRSIPIPIHGKRDIPIGLAKRILQQAGVKKDI
jgi:predicted RNA binding protein YcfA (HicA-like mRNA interferase family)